MKELIAQLEAKLAELRALQSSDPQVNTAFKAEELTQIKEIEPFVQKRVTALKAYEAAQAAKAKQEKDQKDWAGMLNDDEETQKANDEKEKKDAARVKMKTFDMAEIAKTEKDDELKKIPTVEMSVGKDGADLKVAQGDNTVEAGFELDDKGNLKSVKAGIETKDVVLSAKIGKEGEVKVGGKGKDASGNDITVTTEVAWDADKGEAKLKGTYMKEDADGNKEGVSGTLEVGKDKVKVGGELGLKTKDDQSIEAGGSLEISKNKAAIETRGKFSAPILPKKEWAFPLFSMGIATLYATLDFGITGTAEVKQGTQILWDEKSGKLDKMMGKYSLMGQLAMEGGIKLSMAIIELVEVGIRLALKVAVQATMEIGFMLSDPKNSRMMGALRKVGGSLSGKLQIIVGAAPMIRQGYQALGGNPDSLSTSFDIMGGELLVFDAPDWESGKGWDVTKWGFKPGKSLEEVKARAESIGAFFKKTWEILKAIGQFFVDLISNAIDLVVAVAKKLVEWAVGAFEWARAKFSAAYRKEQEAKAHRDATFKKVVESAIKAARNNPKITEKVYNAAPNLRRMVLEAVVMEDKLVKNAWLAIYETKDMQEAENIRRQIESDITEFKITPAGRFEVGGIGTFQLSLKVSKSFKVAGLSVQLYCNGSRMVIVPLDGFMEAGNTQRSVQVRIPNEAALAKIDLTKAKWTAKAVLDLPGDLKDKDSAIVDVTVIKPAVTAVAAKEQKAQAGKLPTAIMSVLSGQSLVLQDGTSAIIKTRLQVNIGDDCWIPDSVLARAPIEMQIRCGSTIISKEKLDRQLKRGIVTVFDSLNLVLPKRGTFFELAKNELNWFTSWFSSMATIREEMRKTPVTLVLVVYGYDIISTRIKVDPGA